ncbi:MAG: aspartate/glutamate racemase family protein [Vibrio sp.]
MKINLINPNTSQAMTQSMQVVAQSVAANQTQVIARSPQHGPRSIESMFDEAIATAALLDVVKQGEDEGVDGHIIACFGDPGLAAAKEIATAPVVGIAQAGFHMASLISHKFSVVTTLSRTIPMAEHLLHQYGFNQQCASVRAVELPVLDLEGDASEVYDRLRAGCIQAIEADKAEAIVLGCAGMADLASELQADLQIPVVDGVCAAVKLIESLNALGLSTSKSFIYQTPPSKEIIGRYAYWQQD